MSELNDSYAGIVNRQRNYFTSGITLPCEFRLQQLKKLKGIFSANEKKILDALYQDLHKPQFEAWGVEYGVIEAELNYAIKKLDRWMRPQKLPTPLFHIVSKSYIYPEPYGVSLVIAPWNYPFLLAMRPVIGAMAAGNTCIIKPAEVSAHTSAVIEELINTNFSDEYLYIVNTDATGTQKLLQQKFDFIFFTGGTRVGKTVYEAAAKNLTPVALELGGKNPCIIDENINIEIAAQRIAWGKFSNTGQTCVAPDYLLVKKNIKEKFVAALIKNIQLFYGDDAHASNDYGRIINANHFNRITNLLVGEKIIYGGKTDAAARYISPTLIESGNADSAIMQEEIFGPLLPIFEYSTPGEIYSVIKKNPDPLVLYVFSYNRSFVKQIMQKIPAGDMCVNETVLHFGQIKLPIGGRGKSGIGKYQGKYSFHEFSHHKSVLDKKFFPELNIRYPPYTNKKLKWLKILMRNFFR